MLILEVILILRKKSFGVSLVIKSDDKLLVEKVCHLIFEYLKKNKGYPRLFLIFQKLFY